MWLRHEKTYASLGEEQLRREVWRKEMEEVYSHNKEAEVGRSAQAIPAFSGGSPLLHPRGELLLRLDFRRVLG